MQKNVHKISVVYINGSTDIFHQPMLMIFKGRKGGFNPWLVKWLCRKLFSNHKKHAQFSVKTLIIHDATYKSIPQVNPLPSPFNCISVRHSWYSYGHHENSSTSWFTFTSSANGETTMILIGCWLYIKHFKIRPSAQVSCWTRYMQQWNLLVPSERMLKGQECMK